MPLRIRILKIDFKINLFINTSNNKLEYVKECYPGHIKNITYLGINLTGTYMRKTSKVY